MAAFRQVFRKLNTVRSLAFCRTSFTPVFNGRRKLCSDKPISYFSTPTVQEMPENLQEIAHNMKEQLGFVPNILRVWAHRPDQLSLIFPLYENLMEDRGSLSKAEKEMIITVTSAYNDCLYCVASHGAMFRLYSKNPQLGDQITTNWREADLTDREKAMLEFAMKLAGKPEPILEEDFDKLSKHGLDREDVWDIGMIVGYFAMSNRLAFMQRARPNDEYYFLGRTKEEES